MLLGNKILTYRNKWYIIHELAKVLGLASTKAYDLKGSSKSVYEANNNTLIWGRRKAFCVTELSEIFASICVAKSIFPVQSKSLHAIRCVVAVFELVSGLQVHETEDTSVEVIGTFIIVQY
jgi:hypothetical protein